MKNAARKHRTVAFVGSGPGDPELLTVRAVRLLEEAEVVVTETAEHLDLVREIRTAAGLELPEFLDGGIGEDDQPLSHAARAKVVLKAARTGQRVVRLMAGDPFVYSSGAEEAKACVKAGIGLELVPGISSVTAVPAYAGIPLTTKDHRSVAILSCTGTRIDWSAYAAHPTLVLLSAVSTIEDVAQELIAAGRDPQTPVSMTSTGTVTT